MALFKVRRTITPNLIPPGLTYGEMAVNITDKRLYVGDKDGNSVLIGATGASAETWSDARPTLATDVAGIPAGTTIAIGTSAIDVLEQMLYPYQSVSFSSLTVLPSLSSTVEIGTTSAAGNYSTSWTSSGSTENWIPQSLFLRQSSPSSASLASSFSITSSPQTIAHPAYRFDTPTTLSFQLTGQQLQGANPSITKSHLWKAKVYYGKSDSSSVGASYSSYSTFEALFSGNPSGLQSQFTIGNTSLGTLTVSWPSSSGLQHYWLFSPSVVSSFGQFINFKDSNNLQNTPAITGNIVITNQNGLAMNYIYYRWAFPTSGPVTFTVS
jgi:hypothetical protein